MSHLPFSEGRGRRGTVSITAAAAASPFSSSSSPLRANWPEREPSEAEQVAESDPWRAAVPAYPFVPESVSEDHAWQMGADDDDIDAYGSDSSEEEEEGSTIELSTEEEMEELDSMSMEPEEEEREQQYHHFDTDRRTRAPGEGASREWQQRQQREAGGRSAHSSPFSSWHAYSSPSPAAPRSPVPPLKVHASTSPRLHFSPPSSSSLGVGPKILVPTRFQSLSPSTSSVGSRSSPPSILEWEARWKQEHTPNKMNQSGWNMSTPTAVNLSHSRARSPPHSTSSSLLRSPPASASPSPLFQLPSPSFLASRADSRPSPQSSPSSSISPAKQGVTTASSTPSATASAAQGSSSAASLPTPAALRLESQLDELQRQMADFQRKQSALREQLLRA